LLQSHSEMSLTPVKKKGGRRVFSSHNNKNIHDRKASMKSLESGYESSSISESNYGAVEEGYIGTQSCTTTVPGDLGFNLR
jgi:hypothetical protein